MRHNAIRYIFFLFILTQLPSPEQERQLGSQGTGYDSFLPFDAVFSCQKGAIRVSLSGVSNTYNPYHRGD